MTIQIRPVETDDDFERFMAIRNAVDPHPMTGGSFRAERKTAIGQRHLLATEGGADVGAATIGWNAMSMESGGAFLDAWVLPAYRGRGAGSAMFDDLTAAARDVGLTRLFAAVVDGDAPSLAFARHRGLEVDGQGQEGHLDLATAPDRSDTTLPGITTTSLAERPDLARAIYDLSMRVRPEIPMLANEPTPSFEAWRSSTIDDPGYVPELSVLALDGERVVGALDIYDNTGGVAFIGMTAVDPGARRRGIGRYLKEELTRRAKTAGWQRIETYNDGANERIRGLNVALGYVYGPVILVLRGLPARTTVADTAGDVGRPTVRP